MALMDPDEPNIVGVPIGQSGNWLFWDENEHTAWLVTDAVVMAKNVR
jgi:hypothetical protein